MRAELDDVDECRAAVLLGTDVALAPTAVPASNLIGYHGSGVEAALQHGAKVCTLGLDLVGCPWLTAVRSRGFWTSICECAA